ncbi:MAG: hypothetical protein HY289_12020 [Planctomycetes bacterium]|nr:hypothetical protein [Planctomycetota bacterium]
MTQKIPQRIYRHLKARDRQVRTEFRRDPESMLRELAFVLKMTERVREEIETDKNVRQPVLA